MPQDRGSGRIEPAQPLAPALVHAAALGLLLWGGYQVGWFSADDATTGTQQQGVSRNAE